MTLNSIIPQSKALERTLDAVNRRLADALYDDPSGNGPAAQALRAKRTAIKAQQTPQG